MEPFYRSTGASGRLSRWPRTVGLYRRRRSCPPYPGWAQSDRALASIASLLAGFHEFQAPRQNRYVEGERPPDDEVFRQIVEGVRQGLERLAANHDASFIDASDEIRQPEAPPYCFRVFPAAVGATPIEVLPDSGSTYISAGECGWIEVPTSPRHPRQGVDSVLAIAEAIAAGRVKERIWRDKATGKPTDSHLRIMYEPGGKWHLTGRVNRPLLRGPDEEITYLPYGPSPTS